MIAPPLRSVLPPPARAVSRLVLSLPDEYRFHPARTVVEQRVDFAVRGRTLTVAADRALPQYDTIAEIVDFDPYRLGALPAFGPDIVEQLDAGLAGRIRALTFEVHDRVAGRNVRTLSERLRALGYRLTSRPDLFGRRALHHLLATR